MTDKQSCGMENEAVEKLLDKLSNLREKFIEIEALETQLKQIEIDVRSLSLHDDLTGTYNLRGFLNLTEQQIKLADRVKVGILILYVQIISAGMQDRELIETGTILKLNYRRSDIIARISDNEFMVVLISAHRESSTLVTGRLKKAIESYNKKEDTHSKLSVRFGVIFYDPEAPCSVDTLFDKAMTIKTDLIS